MKKQFTIVEARIIPTPYGADVKAFCLPIYDMDHVYYDSYEDAEAVILSSTYRICSIMEVFVPQTK